MYMQAHSVTTQPQVAVTCSRREEVLDDLKARSRRVVRAHGKRIEASPISARTYSLALAACLLALCGARFIFTSPFHVGAIRSRGARAFACECACCKLSYHTSQPALGRTRRGKRSNIILALALSITHISHRQPPHNSSARESRIIYTTYTLLFSIRAR